MKKNLHPGAKWLWRIQLIWGAVFFAVFLSFFLFPFTLAVNNGGFSFNLFSTIFVWWIVFVVLILVVGEIWIRLAYNRWFYEFTDDNLKIEFGVIWKTYKNIPYERIQNVDIRRGIIARIIGFSTLDVQTAGYSGPYNAGRNRGAEGYIPAVEMKEAEKLRDFLVKKISGKKGKGGI